MVLEKIRQAVERYGLIDKGDKVIVGVSGGPDSLALLYTLNSLSRELGFKLYVAHLDHMLREGSGGDREFTEKTALRLGLPIYCRRSNVAKLARRGSIEEAARNARLEFFFDIARKIKAKKIALAHNLEDQAETVLMRILRGSGLYGLSAILPKRNIGGFEIIRPLIEVRRKEIEAFLKRKKIKPCIDKSNAEDIYFRNKIRNRLLPLLEREYNKNAKAVLANLAQSSGLDYDYLKGAAVKASGRLKNKINLAKFLKLHPAMQRLVLRLAIERVKGDTRRITFKHIEEIEDLILRRPSGSIVDLPKGISVIKKQKDLRFYLK